MPLAGKDQAGKPVVFPPVVAADGKDGVDIVARRYCARHLAAFPQLWFKVTTMLAQSTIEDLRALAAVDFPADPKDLDGRAVAFQLLAEKEVVKGARAGATTGTLPNEFLLDNFLRAVHYATRCRDVALATFGDKALDVALQVQRLYAKRQVANNTQVLVDCLGRVISNSMMAGNALLGQAKEAEGMALMAIAYRLQEEIGLGTIFHIDGLRLVAGLPRVRQNKLLFDAEQLEYLLSQELGFEDDQPQKADEEAWPLRMDSPSWRTGLEGAAFPPAWRMTEEEITEALDIYEAAIIGAGGAPAVGMRADWRWRDAPEATTKRANDFVQVRKEEVERFQAMRLFESPLHIASVQPLTTGALNADAGFTEAEATFLQSTPRAALLDDALSEQGLQRLQRWLRGSRIWHLESAVGVASDLRHGVAHSLTAQLVRELRERMPNVLCSHGLRDIYVESRDYAGDHDEEPLQADDSAVTIVVWLTDSVSQVEGGDFDVFPIQVPADVPTEEFVAPANAAENDAIAALVRAGSGDLLRVAHKTNRMLVYDSSLLTRQGPFQYVPGFKHRRVMMKLTFGRRGHTCEDAASAHRDAYRQALEAGIVS